MEYTKDIILELSNGQETKKRNSKKRNILKKICSYISNHKIITSAIIAIISFIVLDMYLISSFMNILTEI